MIRLWPDSLFGRLVIVFIVCLLAAQGVGVIVSAREASKALVTLNNTHWTQRYGEIVGLLDSVTPEERSRIAAAMSGVRFKLRV
ncbi:MAG: hypothetical protein ACM3ZT_06445, partial [Bacillota bacterium]